MSTYLDKELADAVSVVAEAIGDAQDKIDAFPPSRGFDTSVQEPFIYGAVIGTTGDEPYAYIRFEDTWVQADLYTYEESKVAAKALDMLRNPGKYIKEEDK